MNHIVLREKVKNINLNVKVPEKTYRLIEDKITPFYRSTSTAHTIRLMIEDIAEMVDKGQMQRVTLQSIHEPEPETMRLAEIKANL